MSDIKILIIEDDKELAENLAEFLQYKDNFPYARIKHYENFEEGEKSFLYEKFDLAIVDIKDDSPGGEDYAGIGIISSIMENIFIPVIFWTGNPLPPILNHLKQNNMELENGDNMISLITKDNMEDVVDKINIIINSKYFRVTQTIEHEISRTLAEHLWKQVRPHYDEYFRGVAEKDISGLQESILRSRVVRKLSAEIDNDTNVSGYAAWRYIYPPVSSGLSTGSILKSSKNGSDEWFIVLSPACNLEPRGKEAVPKSDYLILAKAEPPEEFIFYKKYLDSPSKNRWNTVENNINSKENIYHLPKFIGIPDLFVNLENVIAFKLDKYKYKDHCEKNKGNSISFWDYFSNANSLKHIAILSSPYVENLASRYSHFMGKVGVPDTSPNIFISLKKH